MLLLPTTPAKKQGKTASCWAFSMSSYWETEYYLQHGEWKTISPWFFVYHKLLDHQKMCMEGGESVNKALPSGGLGHTALLLLQKHGYAEANEYTWGEKQLDGYWNTFRALKALTHLGHSIPFLRNTAEGLSRRILEYRTASITKGHPGNAFDTNLIELTSFDHLPMRQDVVLELPDNIEHIAFHNVPLQELMRSIDYCLDHGHSLVWDGGIRGGDVIYTKRKGYARVKKGTEVTSRLRSEYFRQSLTRDDHMLHIVGRDTDENGEVYYIAKDSGNEPGPYKGFIHLYRDYVMLKTISIVMNKDIYNSSKK